MRASCLQPFQENPQRQRHDQQDADPLGKEKVFQDIFKVKAVDTTAAGDTFTGYFIAATIEGRSIQEALRMAAKASSIAVSRPGATPSIPEAEEVKKELEIL